MREEALAQQVGKRIASVTLGDGPYEKSSVLTIRFDDGTSVVGTTEGDCCSNSWVEHLTVPTDIEGATLTGVPLGWIESREATPEEVEESKAHEEYIDQLDVYQHALQTDRGEIVIEYRNNNNGYYGGWIDWRAEA